MTGYLLDTNIVLLALGAPEKIAPKTRRSIEGGNIYLSVVSYWEVVLKSGRGKLDVGDPKAWWTDAVDSFGGIILPLRAEHVSELANLAEMHADPFDRVLLAQAQAENLAFVTTDRVLARYRSARLRIIS